jgi:hypothetical protein
MVAFSAGALESETMARAVADKRPQQLRREASLLSHPVQAQSDQRHISSTRLACGIGPPVQALVLWAPTSRVGGLTEASIPWAARCGVKGRSRPGPRSVAWLDSLGLLQAGVGPGGLSPTSSSRGRLQAFGGGPPPPPGGVPGPAVIFLTRSGPRSHPAGGPEMGRSALARPGPGQLQLPATQASWEGPEQGHPDCSPMLVHGYASSAAPFAPCSSEGRMSAPYGRGFLRTARRRWAAYHERSYRDQRLVGDPTRRL